MSLFKGKERIRCGYLREDYNIEIKPLPVEEYASDVLTRQKNKIRDKSWLLAHQLVKSCYNIPGVPDGAKMLLITSRDVLFDPLKQLDDTWSKENIRNTKMAEIAKEQQHKADGNKQSSVTNYTMILLSTAVVILSLGIAFIGVMNYYKGM